MSNRKPQTLIDGIINGGRRLLDDLNRLLNPRHQPEPVPVPIPVRPDFPRRRYPQK